MNKHRQNMLKQYLYANNFKNLNLINSKNCKNFRN